MFVIATDRTNSHFRIIHVCTDHVLSFTDEYQSLSYQHLDAFLHGVYGENWRVEAIFGEDSETGSLDRTQRADLMTDVLYFMAEGLVKIP